MYKQYFNCALNKPSSVFQHAFQNKTRSLKRRHSNYKRTCDANIKPIYSNISPRISGQDPIIWVHLRLSIFKWVSIQYLGTVAKGPL